MIEPDFLDELIDDRTACNPEFPEMVEAAARRRAKLDISYHDRRLASRLNDAPEFLAEFERQRGEIG